MVVQTRARTRQQLEEKIVGRTKLVLSQVRPNLRAIAGETDKADHQVFADKAKGRSKA